MGFEVLNFFPLLSMHSSVIFHFQVFTWNTDAWGYGPGTTSLYQSHPWVLAVLPNGEALGILADTTRRCEVLLHLVLCHLLRLTLKTRQCFYSDLMICLMVFCYVHKQIDLRKESTIRFIAPSSYPVITFGPFASPTEVLISLSKAIGNFVNKDFNYQ